MAEVQKSSGTRRSEILQAEMRHAADSRNVEGVCTAYVKTAVTNTDTTRREFGIVKRLFAKVASSQN
jgi:hypothetical protein